MDEIDPRSKAEKDYLNHHLSGAIDLGNTIGKAIRNTCGTVINGMGEVVIKHYGFNVVDPTPLQAPESIAISDPAQIVS